MASRSSAGWNHVQYMEQPLVFLLPSPDGGDAVDAVGYLDRLCHALQQDMEKDADTVNAIAGSVYEPIPVYVSMLDDPCAEPTSLEDITQVGLDEWTSLHLAIVMRHERAVATLLVFHQQHASSILEDLLCDSCKTTTPENNNGHGTSTTAAVSVCEKGTTKSPQKQMSSRFLGHQTHPGLGGAFVILEGTPAEEDAVASGGATSSRLLGRLEPTCTVSSVTRMLRPLLQCVVYELSHQEGKAEPSADEDSFAPSFVTSIVRAHCDTLAEYYTRFPSLLVGLDTVYEACRADLVTLNNILKLFGGLLIPVLRGRRIPCAGWTSQSSSTNVTPCGTPQTGGLSRCSQQQQHHNQYLYQGLFFLSCAVQEHHKLAFLVTWTNFREATSTERHPPGSARTNREANVLCDFQVSLWNLKKTGHMVSLNSLWSGHLFVLSRLVSSECPLERFLDIFESDYAMYSSGMTASFIAVMVAGAVVSAFPGKSHLVQLLCKKVKTLLVDVPGVFSPLRHYISSAPLNDAERFEELWLGQTPFSSLKKFENRAEMLSFASIETVLLGAEKLWKTPNAFISGVGERAKAQRALQTWIGMCRDFFLSLRDRPLSGLQQQQRRPAFRSSTDGDTGTTIAAQDTEDHEDPVLRRVCATIQRRLQSDTAPCPAIYAVLYPDAAAVGNSGGDNNESGGEDDASEGDVEALFTDAHAIFLYMETRISDDIAVKFHALYNQATVGDINIPRTLDTDISGSVRWDAWNKLKGMSNDEAKREYVSELRMLQASKRWK